MKKIGLVLLFFCFNLFGQNKFGTIGSKWFYATNKDTSKIDSTCWRYGYKLIYSKDTVINNQNHIKVNYYKNKVFTKSFLMLLRNDTLKFLYENQYYNLMYYGLNINDSFNIEIGKFATWFIDFNLNEAEFDILPKKTYKIKVSNVDYVELAGKQRKRFQFIVPNESNKLEWLMPSWIEGIGCDISFLGRKKLNVIILECGFKFINTLYFREASNEYTNSIDFPNECETCLKTNLKESIYENPNKLNSIQINEISLLKGTFTVYNLLGQVLFEGDAHTFKQNNISLKSYEYLFLVQKYNFKIQKYRIYETY